MTEIAVRKPKVPFGVLPRQKGLVFLAAVSLLLFLPSIVSDVNLPSPRSHLVSDDADFASLDGKGSLQETYVEREYRYWNLTGRVNYNSRLGGVVVHPYIPPGQEGPGYARMSGIQQTVNLPESGNLKAVLKGRNVAGVLAPGRERCADSKLVLEVSGVSGNKTLRGSETVRSGFDTVELDISDFAGEKVVIAGYGDSADTGCGKWDGEFTLLKSLYVVDEGLLSLDEGGSNVKQEDGGVENKSISDRYLVPENDSYPSIEHKSNWWRKIGSPPYKRLKKDFCQLFGGWSRTVIEPPVKTCINRFGYRGKAYNRTKKKDAYRIMAVGDAVTFGQGVPDNQTYPAYLEDYLENDSSFREEVDFQVLNYGFPAWNTKREIQMFRRHGVEFDPDLVVLQYMENDAQRLDRIYELWNKYERQLSDRFEDPEKVRVVSARTAFREERLERKRNMTLEEEMRNVSRHFEQLDNLSDKHGFDVLLLHYSTRFSERHLSYVRDEAERLGWYFFETDLDRVNDYRSEEYLINPDDDFYLNSLGYNLTARQIYRYMKQEELMEETASIGITRN